MPDQPHIYLHCVNCVSAAGVTLEATKEALFSDEPKALTVYPGLLGEIALAYGLVKEAGPVTGNFAFDLTRTNRLIDLCLKGMTGLTDALARYAPERIAVVVGATTSGMRELEEGVRVLLQTGQTPGGFTPDVLNLSGPALHLADRVGAAGPVYTVSNACASGALALASAASLIKAGAADAVVAGGIDGFSRFTTSGFYALGALSLVQCRPFAADRSGINLGEGGALMLLTKEESPVQLAGFAHTCDAYHPSAPDPEGIEVSKAMQMALAAAGLAPTAVDFVSAHGTATPLNDAMEAKAVNRVFGAQTPVASLKGLTGHTLAGAGALQAAFAWILLTMNPEGRLPVNTLSPVKDPALAAIDLVTEPRVIGRKIKAVAGNAFAFGGANASLVFTGE